MLCTLLAAALVFTSHALFVAFFPIPVKILVYFPQLKQAILKGYYQDHTCNKCHTIVIHHFYLYAVWI